MSQQVIIFDTTLRDGEQALQASLSVKEKLQIALALERMGVDVMEVGFPVSSPGDFESVQTIARTIKNSRVCGLARCVEKILMRRTNHCVLPKPSVFIPLSPPRRCTSPPNCAARCQK